MEKPWLGNGMFIGSLAIGWTSFGRGPPAPTPAAINLRTKIEVATIDRFRELALIVGYNCWSIDPECSHGDVQSGISTSLAIIPESID